MLYPLSHTSVIHSELYAVVHCGKSDVAGVTIPPWEQMALLGDWRWYVLNVHAVEFPWS